MRAFTDARGPDTPDELWLCEHPPTYTLGQAARPGHVHGAGDVPLVPTDRGGQVTYHGPGQPIVYTLVDLRRRGLGVRAMVEALERAAIALLAGHGIEAHARPDAPGVYVALAGEPAREPAHESVDGATGTATGGFGGTAKIAALGLRVRRGRSYHGLALNADMDLAPFGRIDPCGHPGLAVTDVRRLGVTDPVRKIAEDLLAHVARSLDGATGPSPVEA